MEQLEFSYTAGKNTQWNYYLENGLAVSYKLSMQPSYDMLGIYFRKNENIFP